MAMGIFEQLAWLTKKVKQLCCWMQEIIELNGIPGPPGPAGGFGAYGSWYSTVDQTNTEDGIAPITVNSIDFQSGVTIVSGSQITFAAAGIYNIQFSVQFHNTVGGGPGKTVNVWFRKNGVDMTDSNGRISVPTDNPFQIVAWNYFVNPAANDYYQLMWTTDNASIILEHINPVVGSGAHPQTPSVIITVNQVG